MRTTVSIASPLPLPHIEQYLQSFIYTMNDPRIRTHIIQRAIRQSSSPHSSSPRYRWIGSWTVAFSEDDGLSDKATTIKKKNRDKKKRKELVVVSDRKRRTLSQFIADKRWSSSSLSSSLSEILLFTVCFLYEENRVHYVSFLYLSEAKRLISFDPGWELYHHGQQTVVPYVQDVFQQRGLLSGTTARSDSLSTKMGRCSNFSFCGKYWGIQYNGTPSSLPADAFCQTWTLFFFTRYLLQSQSLDFSFLQKWCAIHPSRREFFIISCFILPLLQNQKIVMRAFLHQIKDNHHDPSHMIIIRKQKTYLTTSFVLRILLEYLETHFDKRSTVQCSSP